MYVCTYVLEFRFVSELCRTRGERIFPNKVDRKVIVLKSPASRKGSQPGGHLQYMNIMDILNSRCLCRTLVFIVPDKISKQHGKMIVILRIQMLCHIQKKSRRSLKCQGHIEH